MKSVPSDLFAQPAAPSGKADVVDWSEPLEPHGWLSALADGEAQAAGEACRLWREDKDARQAWHTYHLIGDVMRSDELALRPSHDAAFLSAVRARLAVEPVVLAPEAASPSPVTSLRRRHAWLMPAAAAAGFAVVAGVLVVTRMGAPGGLGDPRAPDQALQLVSGQSGPAKRAQPWGAAAQAQQGNGAQVYLRDARLDEYLRVHNVSRGGVAVASPGVSLQPIPVAAPMSDTGR